MKYFDDWNSEKKKIDNKKVKIYINPREIWYTKMGVNVGYEEDGKEDFIRPVLIIKKVGSLFFTVALTSKGKNNNKFYYHFTNPQLKNPHYKRSSYAILSQLKMMDKKRFVENGGTISEQDFEKIKQKIRELVL